jgi:RNA polymerase sigma-70 factor, ECF subfamily
MEHRGSEHDDAVARDISLVARTRRGDASAYGELVRRHMRRAFSIAYGVLRHREDAEDAVQDSFIRALERIDTIEAGRPFHPWLYRIVVNQAISRRRARAVRAADELGDELRSDAPSPARRAEQRELRERLLAALDALPETQRTVVLLADVEEFNSTEIGEMMEMPAGTVRYHLHLGRRALRELLSHVDEEAR